MIYNMPLVVRKEIWEGLHIRVFPRFDYVTQARIGSNGGYTTGRTL